MSDQTRQQLQQALELLKSGQRDQARLLLESIVKTDPDNATAWWMMATAVTSPADMRNALLNVVRIKPDYPNAQQMLDRVNAQLNIVGGVPTTAAAPKPDDTPTAMSRTAPSIPTVPTQPPAVLPTVPSVPITEPTPPPAATTVSATPPTSSGSQIGESLDDLFAPMPPGNTPAYSSNVPSSGPTYTPPAYVPPPAPPVQKKGRSPLLYILIGLVIAVACICGACLLLTGGSFLAVFNNPTFQAAVGTSFSMFDAPNKLPTDAKNMGSISPNQSQSAQLKLLERHVWKYDGVANESIDITVTATTGNTPPYIGLYDKNGNIVVKTQLGKTTGKTQTLTATLSEDATYSILVGGLAGNTASYTITVNSTSRQ